MLHWGSHIGPRWDWLEKPTSPTSGSQGVWGARAEGVEIEYVKIKEGGLKRSRSPLLWVLCKRKVHSILKPISTQRW